MQRVFKSGSVLFAAIGLVVLGSLPAMAQSGSRNYPPTRSTGRTSPPAGSAQRVQPARAPLALEGYCPVSVLDMSEWVKGNPAHRVLYDGRDYLFASEKGKRIFQANPAKYVPALGGDCVVALVKMGKRVPGNIRHASIHDGRLFLFANADAHKMFQSQPAAYANADLALGGTCPVCRVNMGQTVAGRPEIAAFYEGLRYLFPAAEQRTAFIADPRKYVSAASGSSAKRAPAGSGSR